MGDEYIKRLDELELSHDKYVKEQELMHNEFAKEQEHKQRYENFKEEYKKVSVDENNSKGHLLMMANAYLKFKRSGNKTVYKGGIFSKKEEITPEAKGKALHTASILMSLAQKEDNLDYALKGAKIYELLGLGNRASVKNRLLKAYERIPSSRYKGEIKAFLKRNPEKRESGKSLDNKFIPLIAGVSIIAALFFLSPNLTGNIIGNITKIGSNIIGSILFVLGLIGFLFYFKKR